MKFHHVGVACSDVMEEIENIRQLHAVTDVSQVMFDPEQQAQVCMIMTAEGLPIELISGPQVAAIIKKRISYYHVGYETPDLGAEIIRLQALGAYLVSEPKPAILFGGRPVAFLQVSYGLIELIQQ